MDCSTLGFPVLHHLPELVQTHVHWVSDAIQPSCPQTSPSPALNISQHQGLSQRVSPLHQLAKVLGSSFSTNPSNGYSGLISLRMDWFDLLAVQGDSQESSPTPQFESINSSVFSLLYGQTLTSIHDYWKNHSFDYMDLCRQNNASAFCILKCNFSNCKFSANLIFLNNIWHAKII